MASNLAFSVLVNSRRGQKSFYDLPDERFNPPTTAGHRFSIMVGHKCVYGRGLLPPFFWNFLLDLLVNVQANWSR